jgi:hypothetical protein
MKNLPLLLIAALFAGCAVPEHRQTYIQVAPAKYPRTARVSVFEYRNVNLREIYDLLYSDYLIIGRSEFSGLYEDPKKSAEFALTIGADVFVTAFQFKETQTSFVPSYAPSAEISYISGFTGTGSFYGTVTSYGTRTTMIPVRSDRYDQNGMYLKNVNLVSPLWERKRADYKETGANPLSGLWYNENTELKIYKSGSQMVAFFEHAPRGKEKGQIDELKMLFNPETGAGVYLMADRTPQPATIKLNKFGFLEANLISQNDTFSFARR